MLWAPTPSLLPHRGFVPRGGASVPAAVAAGGQLVPGGGQRDPQPMAAGTGWEAHPGDGAGELAPLQRGRGNTGFGEGERWRAPGRARLGRAEREERRSPERE
jgi:hypothetical protein